MLHYPIIHVCFYTDVDCFSCKQARVCRTLNAFQTRACSLFTVIAVEFFHLSKFYLDEETPLLKQCFSYFNCRILNNNELMPKYLLYWPGRQGVREKIFHSKRVRSPKSLGTAGLDVTTSGTRTSETGGGTFFAEIFQRLFIRRLPKNFPPKISSISQ